MAKQKQSEEDRETNKSIGSQIKGKLTQRERNLKVKSEMIAKGERKAPTSHARNQKERNLELKKQLADEKESEGKKGKAKE